MKDMISQNKSPWRRFGLLLLLFACAGSGLHLAAAERPLRIVATTTMVADLVAGVAGERGTVVGLMGAGVDPHLYKATASDVNKLRSADIIFYNGLHLEGRMADMLVKLGRRGKLVQAVTDSVAKDKLLEPAEFEGHYDPHVWFDPLLWADCIEAVVAGLSAAEPASAAHFQARGEALRAEYRAHFDWAVEQIAQIPEARRVLITSHDAYNYFGRAFGFQVIGVQGISTLSEAGVADIAQISAFIKERGIKAIFVESSVSPAAIQRISQDSGVRIGGELYSDAMGNPGQIATAADGSAVDVGTYEGMLKINVSTIVESLK